MKSLVKRRQLCAAVLFSLAIGTGNAVAQLGGDESAEAEERAGVLEEILVSATRTARTDKAISNKVTFVESEEIRIQQTLSLNPTDMLSNLLPSYSPSRQKLTGLGEAFRGRSPLLLIDGVPQSNPLRDGSRDGFTIDLAVVEEVEIVYGANAIQGLGATGGIINYKTLSPSRTGELEQRAELGFTSDDDFHSNSSGWRANYIIGQRVGRWDFIASATYEDRGLFYDGDDEPVGIDETQGDIADSETWNFFAKLGFEPDENQRIQLMVNSFNLQMQDNYVSVDGDRSQGIPTTSIKGSTPGEPAENDVTTITLNYGHLDFLGGRFSAQVYRQDFSSNFGGGTFGIFQDPLIAPVGTHFDQSQNNSEKTGVRFTQVYNQVFDSPLSVIVGVDYLEDETAQALIFSGRDWVPETRFKNTAPFAQLDWDVTEWIQLTGGARFESAKLDVADYESLAGNRSDFQRVPVQGGSPDFDETLINFGGVVRPNEALSLYGTYSEGFSMPDVGRVLRGVNTFDTQVESFLDLAPLITDNLEFGAEYATDRFNVQVAWFESTSDFGVRLVPDADGVFTVNREETRIDGWEISGKFRFTDWVSLGAGIALLDGRFDSDDDGSVDSDLGAQDVGSDRMNLFLDITPPGNFSYRLQSFTYFDNTFRNAAGAATAEFDGYTTVDALVAWAVHPTTQLSLGISNLFDEQYLTYYSQAGNTRNDRYNAGRGRTLTLRANFRF
ncbi:TonB-dependent receptor [Elongatibacter sediminis]|uniref:TonB-dependent receptor n=1 Tax=Elongatibacter sediminis TaxID=3119006 RepID=A0AAW9RDC7_9GAMM